MQSNVRITKGTETLRSIEVQKKKESTLGWENQGGLPGGGGIALDFERWQDLNK